jgi:hypothetical protein
MVSQKRFDKKNPNVLVEVSEEEEERLYLVYKTADYRVKVAEENLEEFTKKVEKEKAPGEKVKLMDGFVQKKARKTSKDPLTAGDIIRNFVALRNYIFKDEMEGLDEQLLLASREGAKA